MTVQDKLAMTVVAQVVKVLASLSHLVDDDSRDEVIGIVVENLTRLFGAEAVEASLRRILAKADTLADQKFGPKT
jgi:hypothetical protein